MACSFGGRACVDPAVLYRDCLGHTPPLPTDWWGRANLFRNPLGRGPGTGCVLLTRADLDALALTADADLVFEGDQRDRVTLKQLTLVRARCITPGHRDDARAVYLCDIEDRRRFLSQVPINTAFNIKNADGDDYLSATTDGGTAWTWAGVFDELWQALDIGATPALPFTPDGTPENLRYHGGWAWEAANNLLDRLACSVALDLTTNTFSVVRLGDTTAAGATALAAALAGHDRSGRRTWDGYWREPDRGRLPEQVRVLFPRRPVPTDGASPYYVLDVKLPATAGVAAGTFVTLRDDLTAVADGGGVVTNLVELTARAAERAADWRRKRVGYERRLTLVYRDFRPDLRPGETAGGAAFDDRGGVMATELTAAPDGALEQWKAWEPPLADAAPATTSPGSSEDCRRKFLSWRSTDCIAVLVTPGTGLCAGGRTQEFDGGWDDGLSAWVGDEWVWTPLGLGRLVVYRAVVGGQVVPAAKLVVGGTDYPAMFVGCTNGRLHFAFGDAVLCPPPASGTPAAACGDHVIDVYVKCAPCGIQVCDDPEYVIQRRICFTATNMLVGDYSGYGFTLGAVALTLVYHAPPPAAEAGIWFSAAGIVSPAEHHWWFAEGTAVITATDYPPPPDPRARYVVGDVVPIMMMFFQQPPAGNGSNCTYFGSTLKVGNGGRNGSPGYYRRVVTLGDPPGLPYTAADPVFEGLDLAVLVLADDMTLSDGECPGDIGGGSEGDSPCCMDAGESLADHPDLEFVVPDGPYAGTYVAAWDGSKYPVSMPNPAFDADLECSPNYGVNFLWLGSAVATSVSCSPFGAVFPGYVFGAAGDITVAIA